MITRAEHLEWCKQRALEYLDVGDIHQALNSMISDLGKHPDTKGHAGIGLGVMMSAGKMLETRSEMRKFIEGFNGMKPIYLKPATGFELRMRRAERKIQIGNVVLWIGFAAFVAGVLAVIDLLLHPKL